MPYTVIKDFPNPGKMDNFVKDFQGPVARQCVRSHLSLYVSPSL